MRRIILTSILLCWLAGVLGGLGALARYTASPGVMRPAPDDWPVRSRILRVPGRATLLLFAHPRCPCTRATLTEWSRLLAERGETVTPTVLFVHSQNTDAEWAHTDLWKSVQKLPNLVLEDQNGVEARRFHADTSGLVLLYSPEGRLLFRGGITPGRGHEGDSAGKSAILDLLRGHAPLQSHTAVFGCSLFTH